MISVCIATHNGEKYIKKQLESILCQLGANDEVVISDDGSEDKTLSIIEGLNDKRIKVTFYSQPFKAKHTHEYVCRNFENAILHSKGDFIFLSDQDDEWLPNKVNVCMKDLLEHDLVLHDFIHIDENETITKLLHYDGKFRPHNYLLRHGIHYGCALAFKKKVLDYVLPFPKHLLLHDYWIGILTETIGSFYFEPEPLIYYRIHVQNTSKTNNTFFFKLSYRFRTILNVIWRICKYKYGKWFR